MLIAIDNSRCVGSKEELEYVQLQNNIKIVRTLSFFVRKSFISLGFSLLSISIVVMGNNGGFFPAIGRVFLEIEWLSRI